MYSKINHPPYHHLEDTFRRKKRLASDMNNILNHAHEKVSSSICHPQGTRRQTRNSVLSLGLKTLKTKPKLCSIRHETAKRSQEVVELTIPGRCRILVCVFFRWLMVNLFLQHTPR